MSEEAEARVAASVATSRRYRHVDPVLVRRLAAEELPRAAGEADAVKRVKRRLHQAVGAYAAVPPRGDLERLAAAWDGSLAAPAFRGACRAVLRRHASTRERLPGLEGFFPRIWAHAGGPPRGVADLGCGLAPLALPWMELAPDARYVALDVDRAQVDLVEGFLSLVGQPHHTAVCDLAAESPELAALEPVDVALLLKVVPLLDRRDSRAAARLLAAVPARHAVVSFPVRSLGGRGKGMERTYRDRLATLVRELGERVTGVAEASVPGELVFVLTMDPPKATHG